MDGTLLKEPVLVFLARKLRITKQLLDYDELLKEGRITKEECLRKQFALFRGTRIDQALEWLRDAPRVKRVREAVRRFKSHDLTVIILSDNFTALSNFFLRFGFDEALGSTAYARKGALTGKGRIVADKLVPLTDFCRSEGIALEECIHVGDWDNDIPVFRAVGLSAAINPKNARVSRNAKLVVETNNLLDVYEKVRPYLADMK